MSSKDGIRARIMGVVMHGAGLKKKYRANADDTRMKGKATRGKK
jgi:hypothetical protein